MYLLSSDHCTHTTLCILFVWYTSLTSGRAALVHVDQSPLKPTPYHQAFTQNQILCPKYPTDMCLCVCDTIQSKCTQTELGKVVYFSNSIGHLPVHSNVYMSKINFACINDGWTCLCKAKAKLITVGMFILLEILNVV